jgi:HAD superfamily hydrolase (TIGR01459 family)
VLGGIEPLIKRYDGFLLDQFGVLHDGVGPFPGVLTALEALRRAGRSVVILSNSGKRAAPNAARLGAIGIGRGLYADLVSSGEAAWQGLRHGTDESLAGLGRRCLLVVRGGDRSAVEGLDLEIVADAGAADFVLLAGLDAGDEARRQVADALARALERRLPLICTNPDQLSLEGDGRVPGPGSFARRYEAMGGEVRWIGKPWPAIYRAALARMALPPARIVAVGDSLDHDIAGAAGFGIDGALVTKGVPREAFGAAATPADLLAHLELLVAEHGCRPRWLLRAFALGAQ